MSGAIPDEVLASLICAECHKYLSVLPVKVFPNRQVKCGRCAKDDDYGVESPHYALITKYVKFPCVNRYEGCNEILEASQVALHETACNGMVYFCPYCNGQCPTGYDMHWHLMENHVEFELKNQEFLLHIDQGDKRHLFFYTKNNLLCFVTCQFTMNPYKLFLDVATLQNKPISDLNMDHQDLKQQFQLFSIDCVNSVCTTDIRKCSKFGNDIIGFEIYLIKEAYSKHLIMCKFNFIQDHFLSLAPEYDTDNPQVKFVKKECVFENVSQLLQGKKLFCTWFMISGVKWTCHLEMTCSNIYYQYSILTAHLQCVQKGANVHWKMTIRASLNNKKGQSFEKVSENIVDQNVKSFIVWDVVKVDENLLKTWIEEGAIKDDCLKIMLWMKIENLQDCKQRRIA